MPTSKVLYFPYIRVPASTWLIRTLLYWDEVGIITPYEFVKEPEHHDPLTLSLIREGLVQQVVPSWYVGDIPHFVSAFVQYLRSLSPERVDARRAALADGRGFLVHAEKLDELQYELEQARLARAGPHPWIEVEPETAQEFMAYLAAALGRLPSLGYAPLTDEERFLTDFVTASSGSPALGRVEGLRLEVLDQLFPAPARPVSVADLARFKQRHGEELRRFRRRVEQQLLTVADISDEILRRRSMELFLDEAQDEVAQLRQRMAGAGWLDVVLGRLTGVLAAIPGVSPLFGLANAVYNAFRGGAEPDPRTPFLYAFEAQRALLQ
jgi:hypothetical protein